MIPGFGQAALLPRCKINALSAAKISSRYKCRIKVARTWTVYMPRGLDIVFKWSDRYRMYVRHFDDDLIAVIDLTTSGVQAYALTASERERQFPKREVEAAKRSRLLQERLYFPLDYALAQSITKGTYLNCDVTPKDFQLAQTIYGFSDTIAAGKTRDMGPVASSEMLAPVHMRRTQSLYLDVWYWHQEPFFIGVFKPLDMVLVRYTPKGVTDAEYTGVQIETKCYPVALLLTK